MALYPKKIWINAGEHSGDLHGALLLKALRDKAPAVEFVGMGGAALREAGLTSLFKVEDLSVMGVTEVFGHLPRIFKMLREIKESMRQQKPDAVVVIDAPDFHFQVIKAARSLGIPVYYYISPKVWAWRSGRANFIRANVQKLISILPFEKDFYKNFGMEIDYIGNPLVDVVDYPSIEHIQPRLLHIGILPGSRKGEIKMLLPEFAKAARGILKDFPEAHFSLVRAPNIPEKMIYKYWDNELSLDIVVPENRWAFMRSCELLIAASGTVTLESALAGVPTIVSYKVSLPSYVIGKMLVNVPFMSLPNLILGKAVFPEFLQYEVTGENIAKCAREYLLANSTIKSDTLKNLDVVRQMLGQKDAPSRGAGVILDDLYGLMNR